MSYPFPTEHIQGLEKFIAMCKLNPGILNYPELSFFKQYIESLGGAVPDIPPPPKMKGPYTSAPPPASAAPEPAGDELFESDVELDMEGVVDPDDDAPQPMGPVVGEVSEEAMDASNEKKRDAIEFYVAGNYAEATRAYTEAIMLNPGSAMLYAKRGQTFLAQKKPNACVRDCDRALELNPDCAAAYKFRGRARRLLGDFVKAAEDLRCACKLDFDEQADEWLKEVTPNARKLEEHHRKYERLRLEQQARLARERVARSREARAKAQADAKAQAPPTSGDMPGGMGIPPELIEILQEPEFINAMKDPEIAAAFTDITTNPANILKHQNNPKVADFLSKMTLKMGGMMGGLGGMMGGMGGFGGSGAGAGPGSGPGTGPAPPANMDVD